MRLLFIAFLIVAIMIMCCYYFSSENFWPCPQCDDYSPYIVQKPQIVINPYVWPYSGAASIEDIYIQDIDSVQSMKSGIPMYNQFVPDHVLKTE